MASLGTITAEARGYRLVQQPADEPLRLNAELSLPAVSLVGYKQSLTEGRQGPAFLVRPPSVAGPQIAARQGEDRDRQNSHEQASTAAGPFTSIQNWLLGKPTGQATAPPVQSHAWHQHKRLVALTSGSAQVLVFDCKGQRDAAGHLSQPAAVLEHDDQHQVTAVAWRPQSRPMLAVGCQQGVCLWNLAGGQQAASSNGSQGPPGAMTLLRAASPPLWCRRSESASGRTWALEFSPDGALLAAACSSAPGVTIWDVARGEGVQVGCGTAAFGLLRWSPCGAYFFAAGHDNHFYIWETGGWTPQRFDLPSGDSITAAHWAPSGRTLLLAQAACPTLRTIHLLGDPPSISTQAYDLLLPELWPTDSAPDQPAPTQKIHTAAWDPTGTRLVVLAPPSTPADPPSIALYATSGAATAGTPIDATFIGYVKAPLPDGIRLDELEMQVVASGGRTLLLLLRLGESLLHTVPLHL